MVDDPQFIATTARLAPDRPAVIVAGTGHVTTYAELNDRSMKLARSIRFRGIGHGGHIAILMDNDPRYFEVAWAAQRSGLYFTPINWHLTAEGAAYIVADCGTQVLVASSSLADLARGICSLLPALEVLLAVGDEQEGFENFDRAIAQQPAIPLSDEVEGADMFYSSGTTGRPKGIRRPLALLPLGSAHPVVGLVARLWEFGSDTVYLSPAPLYHAAPLGISMAVHRVGGTVVIMEKFEPAATLDAISEYAVTHAQFVPTMFVRLLKLPADSRLRINLNSLRYVIHAAAPCPPAVKESIIDWFGPIVCEYYSGTEGIGFTHLTSAEWLEHRGSVGRPLLGALHIVDDEGRELPSGGVGTIYFSGGPRFEYHNDVEKTRASYDDRGWATLFDVGHVDNDGYLYLDDRKEFMVISGGVNIYPQEAENVLVAHPAVIDAAAFGVPHDELGEEMIAVVQLADPASAGPGLAAELQQWCEDRIARFKCPRSIEFADELPRLPTGKLYKRLLRDPYWVGRARPV